MDKKEPNWNQTDIITKNEQKRKKVQIEKGIKRGIKEEKINNLNNLNQRKRIEKRIEKRIDKRIGKRIEKRIGKKSQIEKGNKIPNRKGK